MKTRGRYFSGARVAVDAGPSSAHIFLDAGPTQLEVRLYAMTQLEVRLCAMIRRDADFLRLMLDRSDDAIVRRAQTRAERRAQTRAECAAAYGGAAAEYAAAYGSTAADAIVWDSVPPDGGPEVAGVDVEVIDYKTLERFGSALDDYLTSTWLRQSSQACSLPFDNAQRDEKESEMTEMTAATTETDLTKFERYRTFDSPEEAPPGAKLVRVVWTSEPPLVSGVPRRPLPAGYSRAVYLFGITRDQYVEGLIEDRDVARQYAASLEEMARGSAKELNEAHTRLMEASDRLDRNREQLALAVGRNVDIRRANQRLEDDMAKVRDAIGSDRWNEIVKADMDEVPIMLHGEQIGTAHIRKGLNVHIDPQVSATAAPSESVTLPCSAVVSYAPGGGGSSGGGGGGGLAVAGGSGYAGPM